MHTLTKQQEEALSTLKNNQKGRYFVGTNADMVAVEFCRINEEKKNADPDYLEKLNTSEASYFALCGYAPSP